MKTYMRVSTKDYTGRRRRLILLVTKDSDRWLAGWKADKNGDRTDDFHLIDKSAITKRTMLVMNNHYGELEEAQ
ncbi:hypothetical protein LCGC14_0264280 [marine sediment metagenome]|uniref:Uncharacterized protein n=1 Tax=marine sediment metagenome TaxID=412755 RepID=A0A0F9WLG1_9ZZZZ